MKTFLLLFVLLFVSCSNQINYSKENHAKTWVIGCGLYTESFKTYTGGATTSNSYSYYITDSIHFRKFIGQRRYDDERILWNKIDDRIVVHKITRDLTFRKGFTYDTIQIGNYKIDELVKEGKFE